jgi:hypothetical protein
VPSSVGLVSASLALEPPEGFVARSGPLRGQRSFVREDLAGLPDEVFWGAVEPLAGARGRGGSGKLRLEPAPGLVVRGFARTFRRGGALRHVLPKEGFVAASRVFAELACLEALRARGVSVVRPLAALVRPCGPFLSRLRLVTEEVPGVLPLPAFVIAHPELRRAALAATGALTAQAFRAGLEHPDLHPDNFVVRAESSAGQKALSVWLLDLDRARLVEGPVGRAVADAMLLRMARYVHRHAERIGTRLERVDVLRFLRAMGLNRAGRRDALGRLAPAFARMLARHRLAWGGGGGGRSGGTPAGGTTDLRCAERAAGTELR